MFKRLWVQIEAPYTECTRDFFTLICSKNCIVRLKRPKIKEKEAEVGPFFKKELLNLIIQNWLAIFLEVFFMNCFYLSLIYFPPSTVNLNQFKMWKKVCQSWSPRTIALSNISTFKGHYFSKVQTALSRPFPENPVLSFIFANDAILTGDL